jgi:hypothetical protein
MVLLILVWRRSQVRLTAQLRHWVWPLPPERQRPGLLTRCYEWKPLSAAALAVGSTPTCRFAVVHSSHLPAIRGVLEAPRLPPAAHVMYWQRHIPWRYPRARHPHTKRYSFLALRVGCLLKF